MPAAWPNSCSRTLCRSIPMPKVEVVQFQSGSISMSNSTAVPGDVFVWNQEHVTASVLLSWAAQPTELWPSNADELLLHPAVLNDAAPPPVKFQAAPPAPFHVFAAAVAAAASPLRLPGLPAALYVQ